MYVQEPLGGSGWTIGPQNGVGHVFIGLKEINQTNPNQSITQVFGFYPLEKTSLYGNNPSTIKDNSSTDYTVSITYNVTPQVFNSAINSADYYATSAYDLNDFNCAGYVINIINGVGLSLPKNKQHIGAPVGYTPGRLGKDLRDIKSSNPSRNDIIPCLSTPAPLSKGPC